MRCARLRPGTQRSRRCRRVCRLRPSSTAAPTLPHGRRSISQRLVQPLRRAERLRRAARLASGQGHVHSAGALRPADAASARTRSHKGRSTLDHQLLAINSWPRNKIGATNGRRVAPSRSTVTLPEAAPVSRVASTPRRQYGSPAKVGGLPPQCRRLRPDAAGVSPTGLPAGLGFRSRGRRSVHFKRLQEAA